jgi:hypothetical protein
MVNVRLAGTNWHGVQGVPTLAELTQLPSNLLLALRAAAPRTFLAVRSEEAENEN